MIGVDAKCEYYDDGIGLNELDNVLAACKDNMNLYSFDL